MFFLFVLFVGFVTFVYLPWARLSVTATTFATTYRRPIRCNSTAARLVCDGSVDKSAVSFVV